MDIQASDLTRAEIDAVLVEMSAADWKRAERMSAFAARGVPGKTGEDLLQETIEQLLAGRRRFPRGLHPLVVLKTTMRSNASNARVAERRGPIREKVPVAGHALEQDVKGVEGADRRTPEVDLAAKEMLDAIAKDLETDEAASLVGMAWLDGLRGAEAAAATGLSTKDYDAARKRLLRKLAPHAADRSEP